MKTVVALDIDDVKADFNHALQSWHNRNYGVNFSREDINVYELWDIWGCAQEEAIRRVHEFYDSKDAKLMGPISGAQRGVYNLSEDFELVSVTSRPLVVERMTREWVANYFPGRISRVFLTNGYSLNGEKRAKPDICKRTRARVIVEDSAQNAIDCYNVGIGAVLLDAPWNVNVEVPEGVVRVSDWGGAVEAVREIVG